MFPPWTGHLCFSEVAAGICWGLFVLRRIARSYVDCCMESSLFGSVHDDDVNGAAGLYTNTVPGAAEPNVSCLVA